MTTVTYEQLLVYLTEYQAYCKAWPFVHKLMPDKFTKFPHKNSAQINAMLERRALVMDKYVKRSDDGSVYLTEQTDVGFSFVLLDESSRADFDSALSGWGAMVARIDY